MRRSRVIDVLRVLAEIRRLYSEGTSGRDVRVVRRLVIENAAAEELRNGRYSDRYSAEKSIHDACARRMAGIRTISEFDRLVIAWLAGDATELRRHVSAEARSQADRTAIASFFESELPLRAAIVPQTPSKVVSGTGQGSTLSDDQIKALLPLLKKCRAQAELIIGVQRYYSDSNTTPQQKRHIETTIGAGLWYIRSTGIWSGYVSMALIESHLPNRVKPKVTADHSYPRKIAAAELLHIDWTAIEDPAVHLLGLFLSRYGLVNYVTPSENKVLSSHQRIAVFTDPAGSYERAGVRLVKTTADEWDAVTARNESVIRELIARAV